MAGYLEGYGAGSERRERRVKRYILIGGAVVIVAAILYFTFRTWRQERLVDDFVAQLRAKNYQAAYGLWCNERSPCPFYEFEKFMEDWGPKSTHANAAQLVVQDVESCGGGVQFRLTAPNSEPVALWVEKSSHTIGFAPSAECPGRKWRFREFWRRIIG